MTKERQSHEFQAEVSRLLHLMVHSVYSEKEVFLRELISNASDACDKLRYEAITAPALTSGDEDFCIRLTADLEAKTLTLSDNGIGMNEAELIENLGTIARSGTERFAKALEAKEAATKEGDKEDVNLIGQFGVGFYAAFMVATKVEVFSRRAGEEKTWAWVSEGTGSFDVGEAEDASQVPGNRGTTIVLHIREGDEEYLEQQRLSFIVRTYSDHIALPIILTGTKGEGEEGEGRDDETLNTASALWTRAKSEITEEQYKEFYHHVGMAFDDPALTIHYSAEGRHSFTVLLFLPSMRPMDLFNPERATNVQLYVNRVYITDDAPLLPGYLRFVKGVVDSQDMPLNLSREMLQNNPIVTAIRKALTKRVITEVGKLAEKDPEKFTNFWETFGPVLKEGLYEDADQREALMKIARFKSTGVEGWRSLSDYVAAMKDGQKAIYYLTGDDAAAVAKSPQLEGFKARGIEVLLLADPVDGFWINMAGEFGDTPFKSVTQGDTDLEGAESEDGKKDEPEVDEGVATFIAFAKSALEGKVVDVRISKRLTDSAVCLVASDAGLDMQMEKILAQHNPEAGQSQRILEVNPGHALVKTLAIRASSGSGGQDLEDAALLLLDQARILEGDPLADAPAFAKRMADVMAKAFG
jgi:molecular chaperone HtpG